MNISGSLPAHVPDPSFGVRRGEASVFAQWLTSTSLPTLAWRLSAPAGSAGSQPDAVAQTFSPTLRALVQHLDEIERHRIEADSLRNRAVEAQAADEGAPAVAVLMHRHARVLATHNLAIAWSARVVGAASAAARQLLAAG